MDLAGQRVRIPHTQQRGKPESNSAPCTAKPSKTQGLATRFVQNGVGDVTENGRDI